jgi:hypothetical protein
LTSQNDPNLELETDGHMLVFPRRGGGPPLDDQAKDTVVTPPRFAHFAPLLQALIRS